MQNERQIKRNWCGLYLKSLSVTLKEIKMWRKTVRWNVNDRNFFPAAFYPRPGNAEYDMNLYSHFVSALRVGSPSAALISALSQPYSKFRVTLTSSPCINTETYRVKSCGFTMLTLQDMAFLNLWLFCFSAPPSGVQPPPWPNSLKTHTTVPSWVAKYALLHLILRISCLCLSRKLTTTDTLLSFSETC